MRAGDVTPPRDDYHRCVLRALGVPASDALLADLCRPLESPPVRLFDDVFEALDSLLDRGVRMAVVSDTWIETPAMCAQLGLTPYFSAYVIFEALGCRKPDARMYAAGRDALGLAANERLFVDDTPALVHAAIALGYEGAVIDRSAAARALGIATISDLRILTSLF